MPIHRFLKSFFFASLLSLALSQLALGTYVQQIQVGEGSYFYVEIPESVPGANSPLTLLGQGSYGKVIGNSEVVLKIPHFMGPSEVREAAFVTNAKHPHILCGEQVNDLKLEMKVEGGFAYVGRSALMFTDENIMDGDLRTLFAPGKRRRKTLYQDNCLVLKSFIVDVLLGLHYLHSGNYVHGDLKPENLLYKEGRVRIADLGMVRDLDYDTDAEPFLYSPWYRAPEVAKSGDFTSKSDIYALGQVLVYLTANRPLMADHPFEGEMTQDQWNKYILRLANNFADSRWRTKVSSVVFQELPSTVSSELQDLITCMLRVDPDRRYSAENCLKHPFLKGLAEEDELQTMSHDTAAQIFGGMATLFEEKEEDTEVAD